ncbi:hypothetical protein AAEO56_00810 [Flavobacterium sp. DGU11]|uniref:Lipoprotein n=1 Tax=Flavobacterium arundinis TaxID=3139143 RepID=A0ABU9HSJ9_9FLAO
MKTSLAMGRLILKSVLVISVLFASCKNEAKKSEILVRDKGIDTINEVVKTDVNFITSKEATLNKVGDTIYGDFNGDGKLENAFRVLIKKGYGNPVEDGIPDEYEIHFSDKRIKPVKVDCCWFKLINEGDLDKDGANEITIVQAPMDGCIGSVNTFTIKAGKSYRLIHPFTIYWCADITDSELQKLVVSENNSIYYYEANPNDENLLSDNGDKIRFERLIKNKATVVNTAANDNNVLADLPQTDNEVIDNTSINNLKDLLVVSELSLKDMVSSLQYTWDVQPPVQDTSEKGYVTERYIFAYDKNGKKQILKRCGRMDMNTGRTLWLTNFISDDLDLLNKITTNLKYQGFELTGKQNSQYMYEDGNRMVMIKKGKKVYEINVVLN